MKNFYLCSQYSLDKSKTHVYCYHGHNSPYDVLEKSASIKRVELDELLEDYKRYNPEGESFKERWGFTIAELRDKIIFGDTMRHEGDEWITKIDAIDKAQKNDVAALNQVFANLNNSCFIKTIDEIMAEMPNVVFSKQRIELEEEQTESPDEECEYENEDYDMRM